MPNSCVFPGGVHEAADESPLWLKHFDKFGLQKEKLQQLKPANGERPSMFKPSNENCLEREISLRITAVRETFEEVGVMLCHNQDTIKDSNGYGYFLEDFDRQHWQRLVHNDASQFIKMCQELNVFPDLWSLHEWSTWQTPLTFKKRFQTAFFMVALQKTPELLIEKNEVAHYAWKSPLEYLKSYVNKELYLPPPQFYELSRLLHKKDIEELRDFACRRAAKGSILMLPVQYRCTDGIVGLLPGDDMYPKDTEGINDFIPVKATMQDFRSGATRLHRSEFVNPNKGTLLLNFPLKDGQLSPVFTSTS
ncbi:nucleoside diphosphate-linked moiety X motif 19-like isoform X2 [Teleopsis dalmanni]|nr:nucleoside diphosphate-linked moiety X motif 19-like isoform X2 [Teleopsis dalmanni]